MSVVQKIRSGVWQLFSNLCSCMLTDDFSMTRYELYVRTPEHISTVFIERLNNRTTELSIAKLRRR